MERIENEKTECEFEEVDRQKKVANIFPLVEELYAIDGTEDMINYLNRLIINYLNRKEYKWDKTPSMGISPTGKRRHSQNCNLNKKPKKPTKEKTALSKSNRNKKSKKLAKEEGTPSKSSIHKESKKNMKERIRQTKK